LPKATVEKPLPQQKWVRDLRVPPGYLKTLLPIKVLGVGRRGNCDELSLLLKEHPDYLNRRGSNNRTLLWEAARSGKLPAVKWLVARGADVNVAGCYNSETMVQVTPYCAAVYYKHPDVAAFLHYVAAPPDIFRAAFLGERERVNALLGDPPDPLLLNAEDEGDSTYYAPLIAFAVAGGHRELCADLLGYGADVAPYSQLLLQLAAKEERLDLVELLAAHGADYRAVNAGALAVASDLDILRYFLDRGMPADEVSWGGFTPLIYVSRADKGENVDKVRLFLDHGADVNRIGPRGRTALHYAAAGGFAHVTELLLERGAVTDVLDDDGETPLSLARKSRKPAVIALLMGR
jgi:ankyrin repeat protein